MRDRVSRLCSDPFRLSAHPFRFYTIDVSPVSAFPTARNPVRLLCTIAGAATPTSAPTIADRNEPSLVIHVYKQETQSIKTLSYFWYNKKNL